MRLSAVGTREGWSDLDLGVEWTRWTGLPFVYAFWLWRAPAEEDDVRLEVIETFRASKSKGIARIDEIVRQFEAPASMSECDCRSYLSSVISYELNEETMEGLQLFFKKLREAKILDIPGSPLRTLASSTRAEPPAVESVRVRTASGNGTSLSG